MFNQTLTTEAPPKQLDLIQCVKRLATRFALKVLCLCCCFFSFSLLGGGGRFTPSEDSGLQLPGDPASRNLFLKLLTEIIVFFLKR